MSIRIIIADDHPVVINGLQNMLTRYPELEVIGTYNNGMSLLKALQSDIPDVILLDIQLPDKTGDELTPLILKKYPDIKILALTNFNSILYVNSMMRHGAKGYLLKTTEEDVLIEAINKVYNGEEFVEPALREDLRQFELNMKRESSLKATLTPREKEILQLIVNGDTGQEIAEKLFLSFNTVEHYRVNILLKMDVKNTAALVKKALTIGWAK